MKKLPGVPTTAVTLAAAALAFPHTAEANNSANMATKAQHLGARVFHLYNQVKAGKIPGRTFPGLQGSPTLREVQVDVDSHKSRVKGSNGRRSFQAMFKVGPDRKIYAKNIEQVIMWTGGKKNFDDETDFGIRLAIVALVKNGEGKWLFNGDYAQKSGLDVNLGLHSEPVQNPLHKVYEGSGCVIDREINTDLASKMNGQMNGVIDSAINRNPTNYLNPVLPC